MITQGDTVIIMIEAGEAVDSDEDEEDDGDMDSDFSGGQSDDEEDDEAPSLQSWSGEETGTKFTNY